MERTVRTRCMCMGGMGMGMDTGTWACAVTQISGVFIHWIGCVGGGRGSGQRFHGKDEAVVTLCRMGGMGGMG